MDWPTGTFLSRHIRLPADMQLRQLGRADVPAVIAALGVWYPDLAMGKEHVLLTSTFYDDKVALMDEGHTGPLAGTGRADVLASARLAVATHGCSGQVYPGRTAGRAPALGLHMRII